MFSRKVHLIESEEFLEPAKTTENGNINCGLFRLFFSTKFLVRCFGVFRFSCLNVYKPKKKKTFNYVTNCTRRKTMQIKIMRCQDISSIIFVFSDGRLVCGLSHEFRSIRAVKVGYLRYIFYLRKWRAVARRIFTFNRRIYCLKFLAKKSTKCNRIFCLYQNERWKL